MNLAPLATLAPLAYNALPPNEQKVSHPPPTLTPAGQTRMRLNNL